MSDFSDRPFVAGSIFGLRAFDVDRLGRLTSVYHPAVFRPGVNEAKCKKSLYDSSRSPFFGLAAMGVPSIDPVTGGLTWTVTTNATSTQGAKEKKGKDVLDHTVGTVDCTCGYYAYFDGGNDYRTSDRITGIIEGFGVCTVGSRGFRAAKARLVALVTPKRFDQRWNRVVTNYPEVAVFKRKRDAIAAYPLTDAVPTPESHADFWEMEVPR